ncbi:MAG: tetratricopeptide repeat protein [Nitrospirota bacterium]
MATKPPQLATIALVEQPWAVTLDITGYRIQVDGLKPDGRRYFLATNNAASIHLSVTLEAVSGQATEQGCLAHLERIARTSPEQPPQDITRYEIRQVPVLEYLLPETKGTPVDQLHLFACVRKDNVYTDIHVAKTGFTTGDDSRLREVLQSLAIIPAPLAGSLDHFRAGSVPYLQRQFRQAISHYEQAIALERTNPTLDRALWRLLVHNLAVAYGMTGDLARAKTTLDYGLSQDPANPLFHYDLARTYAGMNDRERAMQSLHAAFHNDRQRDAGDRIPDPRQDVSFKRFMLDPAFKELAESLMRPAI